MKKIFIVLTIGLIVLFGAFGVVHASGNEEIGTYGPGHGTAPSRDADFTITTGTALTSLEIWNEGGEVGYSYYGTLGLMYKFIIRYTTNNYNPNAEVYLFDGHDCLNTAIGNSLLTHYNDNTYTDTIEIAVLSYESNYSIGFTDTTSAIFACYSITTMNAPSHTITYNLDGGANHIDNPATFVAGDLPITLEEPTRAGYAFVAWHDAVSLDSPITQITLENDIEIWAEYELIPPPPSMPELIFGALATIITSVVALFASMFSQDGIMRIFWTTENGLTFVGTLSLLLFGLALVRIGLHFVKRLLMFKD